MPDDEGLVVGLEWKGEVLGTLEEIARDVLSFFCCENNSRRAMGVRYVPYEILRLLVPEAIGRVIGLSWLTIREDSSKISLETSNMFCCR